jgi:hypothetical protein
MRVLLIHANPFQRLLAAPPETLGRLRSRLDDLAETRIADPFVGEDWRSSIDHAVADFRPDLIGFGLRAVEDVISLLPEVRALRDRVATLAPDVPIIANGTTSAHIAPALLADLEIPWGITNDAAFCRLVERAAGGLDWRSVGGLIPAARERDGMRTSFGGAFLAWP